MKITEVELKILIKEFLTASNRVLRARFEVYSSELAKFIQFIETHKLIYDYVKSCGEPEYDVEAEVEEVANSYGRAIFSLGSSAEKEVANVFAVVKYLADNKCRGQSFVFYGYSHSKKYQDKVDGFGNDFIRILISHIESYLTRLSIEMGVGNKPSIQVNVDNSDSSNSQINVAVDGASITAQQTLCDESQLKVLIENLIKTTQSLEDEDKETVLECTETIETINDEKPKKRVIKGAIRTLQAIKGTAEFTAAVFAIVQFLQGVI